jgi:hypothetical protein
MSVKRLIGAFLITGLGVCLINARQPVEGEIQDVWTGVDRIVAVGSVHGNYGRFVSILQTAGLIDAETNWSGGTAHLVQTGNVVHLGPHSKRVLDLLIKLQEQARAAGGHVHALIGNHEVMNLTGDLRYATPEEYAAFADENSKALNFRFFDPEAEAWKVNDAETQVDNPAGQMGQRRYKAFRAKWVADYPLGYFKYRYAFGPDGDTAPAWVTQILASESSTKTKVFDDLRKTKRYAPWATKQNVAIRINDTLFVHGGISPKYASSSIREINETVRGELVEKAKLKVGMAVDPEGPLWYEGLGKGSVSESHVEQLLKQHQVKRIVEGHTHMPGAIMPRFEGKVLAIDAGLRLGRMTFLVIEEDKTTAVQGSKSVDIPSDSNKLLGYLKESAATMYRVPPGLQAAIKSLE